MKKSQLRKIIRESIKELMVEQSNPYAPGTNQGPLSGVNGIEAYNYDQNGGSQNLTFYACGWTTTNTYLQSAGCCSSYGTAGIDGNDHGQGGSNDITTQPVFNYQLVQNAQNSSLGSNSGVNGVYARYDDCVQNCTPPSTSTTNHCFQWQQSQNTTTSSGSCNQSAWGNYSNWVNTFENLPNFTSSNPNQPCQMLCKKMNNWITKLQTEPGPNFSNQLQCKLNVVQSLMQTHNCASSNAPAC